MLPAMGITASGNVLKVWIYAAAGVLLGAWFAPLLYNAGKALAEVSSVKRTNGPLQWLAGICRTAEFPAFFETSLLIAAGILFLPFMHWLRTGARDGSSGQWLQKNPNGCRQWFTGFLLVTVLFLLIAGVLVLMGVFEWKNPGSSIALLVVRSFVVALVLAVIQEVLFRGIVMGIFLRAMGPAAAIVLAALLFTLVHALRPPPGLTVADPDAAGVGFELLRKIIGRLSNPQVVLGTLTPLLALGGVLAYARWRTASLYLPVGLHAGWIFVNAMLGSVMAATSRRDSMTWVISGTTLEQGIVPLIGILVAGILTYYLTRRDDTTDTAA